MAEKPHRQYWEETWAKCNSGDLTSERLLPYLKKAEHHAESCFGPYHPRCIEVLVKQADTQIGLDSLVEALHTLLEAKKRVFEAYGEEHQLTVQIYRLMGKVYSQQKLYFESSRVLAKAIWVLKLLPDTDALTLISTLEQQGRAFERNSEFNLARESYEEMLNHMRENNHRVKDLYLAQTLVRLGFLYHSDQIYDEALSTLEQALQIFERTNFTRSELCATCLLTLAQLYQQNGEFPEARECLDRAAQIFCSTGQKLLFAQSLQQMGELYLNLSKPDDAVRQYCTAHEILLQEYGALSAEVATAQLDLGELYYNLGKYGPARESLEKALAIQVQLNGDGSIEIAEPLHNLGILCLAEDLPQEAQLYFEQSLSIRKRRLGMQHPDTALSLYALGTLHKMQGQFEQAKDYLERSLALRRKMYGDEDESTREILRACLDVADRMSLNEKAANSVEPETTITEIPTVDLPRNPVQTQNISEVATLFNSALMAQQSGEYRKAIEQFEQSLVVLENEHGKDHPDLLPILDQLILAHDALGHNEYAARVRQRADALRSVQK